jgi:hypothetical protein
MRKRQVSIVHIWSIKRNGKGEFASLELQLKKKVFATPKTPCFILAKMSISFN